MEIFKNPYIMVGGLAFLTALGFIIYFFVTRRERKSGGPSVAETQLAETIEKILGTENPNTLYFDVKKRVFGKKKVDLIKDKDYGREWLYNGDRVFAVANNGEGGVLKAVTPPYDLEESPFKLYWAISTMGFMRAIFGSRKNSSDKTRIGLMIAAVIVALFLMYLSTRE